MAQFPEILTTDSTTHTVQNTTTLTSIFSETIDGGLLSDGNTLRWQMQGDIGFSGQNIFADIYLMYAGFTVATCQVKNIASGAKSGNGLRIDAELSGDGSVTSQFGTIHSYLGLPRSEDGSTPVGSGTIGANSNGDQTFEIKVKWSATGVSNTFHHYHSTLELLSFVEETEVPDLDEPTSYIFISSRLNGLRYDLRKDAYVYLPLEHDLLGLCFGAVGFTRSSTSTAIWRDGAAHSVAVDEPRFEYSGDTVLGLKLSTGETLNVSTQNTLDDSNTLCWIQDGVYKSTKRGDSNIFNSSGTCTITSGAHIMHVTKFNKILTAAEDSEVEIALTS